MPQDLTITATSNGTTNIGPAANPPNISFTTAGSGNNAYVLNSQVQALSGNIQLQASRDVNVSSDLQLTSQSLELDAGRDITVSSQLLLQMNGQPLQLTTGRNLTIRSGASVQAAGDITLIAAAQSVDPGNPFYDNSGSVVVVGNLTSTGGAVTLSAGTGEVDVGRQTTVSTQTGLTINTTYANIQGVISGAGRLIDNVSSSIVLANVNTYTGGTTISQGTLDINPFGSIVGDVVDNGVLEFSHTDSITFAGAISGTGAVQADNGGTLTLSATNTYTGGTTVTGGATLVAAHRDGGNNSDSLGSGTVTLNGGRPSPSGPRAARLI